MPRAKAPYMKDSKSVSVKIPLRIHDGLIRMAAANYRSRTNMLRFLIVDNVEKWLEENRENAQPKER